MYLPALLALHPPALAQDPPPPEPPAAPAEEAPSPADPELQAQLVAMQAQLAALQGQLEEEQALQALISAGATLVDDRQPFENRSAAAALLAQSQTPWALPFLRAAVRDRDPKVQSAALHAAAAYPALEIAEIGKMAAADAAFRDEVREAAVALLGDLQIPAAAEALWELSGDKELPAGIRQGALQTLEARYPTVFAELGRPEGVSDRLGAALAVGGSSVVGGVMLSSVGTWGQFDAGPAIGGFGGALIGGGSGALYLANHPVTRSEGLAWSSGVGWGLTTGLLASTAIEGPYYDRSASSFELAALYRILGTGLGAGLGTALASKEEISPSDITEIDISGYLGLQLARGVHDLIEDNLNPSQSRAGASIGGMILGLGAGAKLQEYWALEDEDLLLAGVMGFEGLWLGIWTPFAIDSDFRAGAARTVLHSGLTGGLLLSEVVTLSPQQSGLAFYGSVVGNAAGAGAAMLSGTIDEQFVAQVMLPVGLLGTVAGPFLAKPIDPSEGDWSMVAVGTTLAAAEAATLGYALEDRGVFTSSAQYPGLVLTGASVVSAGLMGLSAWVEPESKDMLFLGSSAVWGAWFGALVPTALQLEGDETDLLLIATASGDVFLAAGGLLISPVVGLDPRDTVGVHLGGLTGATVGALGAAIFTGETHIIAGASAGGTALGMGAGGLLTWRLRQREGAASWAPPRPRLDLPGVWRPTVSAGPEGEGWVLRLSATNL